VGKDKRTGARARRFYRRKYDAAKTLDALNTRLRNETDLNALRNDLVGVVGATNCAARATSPCG